MTFKACDCKYALSPVLNNDWCAPANRRQRIQPVCLYYQPNIEQQTRDQCLTSQSGLANCIACMFGLTAGECSIQQQCDITYTVQVVNTTPGRVTFKEIEEARKIAKKRENATKCSKSRFSGANRCFTHFSAESGEVSRNRDFRTVRIAPKSARSAQKDYPDSRELHTTHIMHVLDSNQGQSSSEAG